MRDAAQKPFHSRMSMTTPKNSSNTHETLPLVHDGEPAQSIRYECFTQIRQYAFFLTNVAAWYNTNGMNGISMQSFAREVFQEQQAQGGAGVDNGMTRNSLLTITAITSVVTAFQLFLGAFVGYCLLVLHAVLVPSAQRPTLGLLRFDFRGSILSALHGIGSICTNLGFMYGSASLVRNRFDGGADDE